MLTRLLYLLLLSFIITTTHIFAKIPLIIDTDVGSDFDDSAAIAAALQSDEFEIKLILTATGDTTARARVVAKYLTAIKRDNIPIGIGLNVSNYESGPLYSWSDDFNLNSYNGMLYQDGINAAIDVIRSYNNTNELVTILAIAPCNNFPVMLQRAPDIVSHVKIVAMSGSVYRGYLNSSTPDCEYNVCQDPSSSQLLYTTPWAGGITITPLDTCGVMYLHDNNYDQLLRSDIPLVTTLMEMNIWWARYFPYAGGSYDPRQATSVWYDAVAVYLATTTPSRYLNIVDMMLRIEDNGMMIVDHQNGTLVHVALTWLPDHQPEAFETYLTQWITQGLSH